MTSPERPNQQAEADATVAGGPEVALFCTDLMFLVQLQNMAKKAGLRYVAVRPGAALPAARLLVVDLSSRGDVQAAIKEGVERGMRVVAFGPHMDAEGRRAAKAVGASRVLANSNLSRDLPLVLAALHEGAADGTDDSTITEDD